MTTLQMGAPAAHGAGSRSTDRAGAWRAVRVFVGAARRLLGTRLVSAYAIGSLAHGGFEPAVSDLDVALLVESCTRRTPPLVADAVAQTRARCEDALTGCLSVFYAACYPYVPRGRTRLHREG